MKKVKIQIKNRFTGSLLFEYECENNTTKKTLEKAVSEGADLYGAGLRGADLRGADLRGADLREADLYGANLYGANLYGVNLYGADLRGAVRVPMFCKWSFGFTDNEIHIGCEKRTIEQWDEFFNSDRVIETKRETEEFKQIQAVYEGLKAYHKFLNK